MTTEPKQYPKIAGRMVRKYIKLNKNYSLLIQEVCEAYNADYLLMYSILIFEDF
ncbi:hypothetical protein HMPREF3214_00781 [Alloscardovia omnicolens]|nr:hypothetical protein HMPREF3214_00781 [Alloscardovia omnicolens]